MKGVLVTAARPEGVPRGWRVFNAPRPLSGHREWIADWIHGTHYAAVDPAAPDAGSLTQLAKADAAVELVYADPARFDCAEVARRYYARTSIPPEEVEAMLAEAHEAEIRLAISGLTAGWSASDLRALLEDGVD